MIFKLGTYNSGYVKRPPVKKAVTKDGEGQDIGDDKDEENPPSSIESITLKYA